MRGKQKDEAGGQLGPTTAEGVPARITPMDIQQKEFRLAFRGYNERDVDQFLDQLTEEVARIQSENKRLREDMGAGGTAPLDPRGAAEADAMVRQARAEASRIVAVAEAEASRILAQAEAGAGSSAQGEEVASSRQAAVSDSSSRHMVNALLAREREFLQTLANLIQGHAQSVKEDLRQAREAAASAAQAPASPAPVPTPADEAPVSADDETPSVGPSSESVAASDEAEPPQDPASTPSPSEEAVAQRAERPSPEDQGSAGLEAMGARPPSGSALHEDDGPPTQVWRHDAGTDEQVLDLTGEPAPSHSDPTEPPGGPGNQPVPVVDEGDRQRSLRELFWGED